MRDLNVAFINRHPENKARRNNAAGIRPAELCPDNCGNRGPFLLESISLLNLLWFHGIILAILLALGLKPPEMAAFRIFESLRKLWNCADAPLKTLLIFTFLTATAIFILVVCLPPNNHDSMTYHMARVGYYLQQGSLKSFPTANLRQTVSPANAEILILWQAVLLKCDRTAGLIQWLSWIGCVLAIYGIAAQLRAPPKGAMFAALAFASFPEVVLQSSTAQNDLTAAFFLLCAFIFIGEVSKNPSAGSILCGISLGLAIGTKILSFNPRKLGQSDDDRDLSWGLYEFALSSGSSAR